MTNELFILTVGLLCLLPTLTLLLALILQYRSGQARDENMAFVVDVNHEAAKHAIDALERVALALIEHRCTPPEPPERHTADVPDRREFSTVDTDEIPVVEDDSGRAAARRDNITPMPYRGRPPAMLTDNEFDERGTYFS